MRKPKILLQLCIKPQYYCKQVKKLLWIQKKHIFIIVRLYILKYLKYLILLYLFFYTCFYIPFINNLIPRFIIIVEKKQLIAVK